VTRRLSVIKQPYFFYQRWNFGSGKMVIPIIGVNHMIFWGWFFIVDEKKFFFDFQSSGIPGTNHNY